MALFEGLRLRLFMVDYPHIQRTPPMCGCECRRDIRTCIIVAVDRQVMVMSWDKVALAPSRTREGSDASGIALYLT